jgi:hypothetical protein
MKTMRDFVADARLHRALDEVEAWFGYEFKAAPMPLAHRKRAKCTMHMHPLTNECELLFIEDEPQSQALYCHELNHAVMWILGGPCGCYSKPIPFQTLLDFEPVYLSWGLIQHLPLWELTREMGFDEREDYLQMLQNMIDMILQHRLYLDAPSELRTPFQSVALAFGLAAPATPETRVQIRTIASEKIPQALELADAILSDFEKLPLLSEPGCQTALVRLFEIIKPRIERLQLSFLDRISPNFRSRILEAARQGGKPDQ